MGRASSLSINRSHSSNDSKVLFSAAGLLGFNDGKWQGQLASFGLADRAWAESIHDRKPKLALDAGLK